MKKLFVAVLAIAGVVACSNEELVRVQDPAQIAFDGSFVETRANEALDPSTTTASIKEFSVWGYMDEPEGKVFVEEKVTKSGNVWGYANTQYWVPGHNYYFAALSNYTGVTNVATMTVNANEYGLGLIEYDLAQNAGGEDLLYSAVGPIAAPAANATTVDPVKFTFNHMLSKVKFSFTNGFANELATIDVKNVRMVVPAQGSINVAQQDWWSTNKWELGTETVELAFGDACAKTAIGATQESANERIVFPADATQSYAIAFDVALYQGDVVAYEGTKNATVEGVALEIGKAYNFTVTLDEKNITAEGNELLPIKFTVVEVKEWVNAGDQSITVLPSLTVNSNESVTLDKDYAINGAVMLTNGASLDGGNNTLYAEAEPTDNGLVRPSGEVTISNVTIAADGQTTASGNNLRAFYINAGGVYKLDNVTTTGTGYAINVNTTQDVKLTVTNSTLEGWTSYGTSTTASFTKVVFNGGIYNTFRPYGTTLCENCEFNNMVIDLGSLGADCSIEFKNCTVNGEALAASHLTGAEGKNVTIN